MLGHWWRKAWLRNGDQGIAALYIVAIAFAAQLESSSGWLAALGAIAALALLAWIIALRRRRAITDTPTSRIASAAQGYLELCGRGRPFDSGCLHSPLRQTPCLWFRYLIERRDSEDKWQTEEQGESDASFLLDDGSGQCVIDPDGADITTRHKDSWRIGDRRYSEWLFVDGDAIYGLGEFRTLGGEQATFDTDADVGELLAVWKKDPVDLRRRFDLDGNGDISEQEWQLARQAARREVEKQHQAARRQAAVNMLRRPDDGRPFLISNLPPESLARRYGLWAFGHLLVFLAALTALPFALSNFH